MGGKPAKGTSWALTSPLKSDRFYKIMLGNYVACCLGLLPENDDRAYCFMVSDEWKQDIQTLSGLTPANLRMRYTQLGSNAHAIRQILENLAFDSDHINGFLRNYPGQSA